LEQQYLQYTSNPMSFDGHRFSSLPHIEHNIQIGRPPVLVNLGLMF